MKIRISKNTFGKMNIQRKEKLIITVGILLFISLHV
jgi:hypothetical protein